MQAQQSKFDVAIIGGGILGVTISYWLSTLYDCSILLIDKESNVGMHTSSRNTGMVHRPFYLNPEKKRLFATAAEKSYFLWRDLASKYNLTWKPVGTLEVAMEKAQLSTLDRYGEWAVKNGMDEDEFEILDGRGVQELEPEVSCAGAIFSKTDTCVNYGEFTSFVFEKALNNGVKFLGGCRVLGLAGGNQILIRSTDGQERQVSAAFVINAAGGGSVGVAHKFGVGDEYTDLYFRGEYWRVSEPFASKITRNIYSVPRYGEFPFLDPHYIVRANGAREIGPNAVLVFAPGAYKGLSEKRSQIISKIFERPITPKVKLFTGGTFLSLVWHEWKSSVSKKAMCDRVKQFIPSIDVSYLYERGLAGVRSSVIDSKGFVPEAVLLDGESSVHILNYNSPGATGAPAFSAHIVSKLIREGRFDGIVKKTGGSTNQLWNFEYASDI